MEPQESLTYEEIAKIAASVAVAETIKTMEEKWAEREKKQQDNRLHNTKLLLKNYRLFKKHQNSSLYSLSQLENNTAEFMALLNATGDNIVKETKVESISNTKAKTTVLLRHLDEMIGVYRHLCEKSGKPEELRRFLVLEARYIAEEEVSMATVAERLNVDDRTVYKDLRAACEKMSVLLFGVDVLK